MKDETTPVANSGRRLILQIKLQIQEEISVDLIFSPFTQSITDGGAKHETGDREGEG